MYTVDFGQNVLCNTIFAQRQLYKNRFTQTIYTHIGMYLYNHTSLKSGRTDLSNDRVV